MIGPALVAEVVAAIEADPHLGARLADALAPYLAGPEATGWLDTRAAADHLGMSVPALHALRRSGAVNASQPGGTGGKLYYAVADLDSYRRRASS